MTELRRVLQLPGAVVVGVGAMLGTGVFAVWTPAFRIAGSALLFALLLAAAVAALNATSTASLARAVPRAGGVYAYGKAFIGRWAGVAAGYAFVIGKSASAGAAALTIGAYLWPEQQRIVGLIAVALALAWDLRGIVRSVRVTVLLITVVVVAIVALSVAWWGAGLTRVGVALEGATPWGILGAAGLLFVAFAGYARITVLGEEVAHPTRTIPRAMALSFGIVIVVYVVVGMLVLSAVDSGVKLSAAPLESVAAATNATGLVALVRLGAVFAAGAVLLSLIAGIGRTLFAMGRDGDAPGALNAINDRHVPWRAEVVAAALTLGVVAMGGIGLALALSAATILTYYGIAHVCVLARWRGGDASGRLALAAAVGLMGCIAVVVGVGSVAFSTVG